MTGRPPRAVRIALLLVAQSTQNLTVGGIALFLPLIRSDLDMSFSEAGVIAVGAMIVYAFMQVPSGYLADRFGAKRVFLIGLLGMNAMTFLLATCQSYEALLVNQTVAGFFRALVFAPGLILITAQFPTARRATAMSVYVASGFLSSLVLNLIGPSLVEPLGWRALLAVFSGVSLIFVAAFASLGGPGPQPGSRSSQVSVRELAGLLRHRIMFLASVVQFTRLAVVSSLRFWLPTYLVVDKGFTLQTAGLVVAMGAAIMLPANLIGGYVSDRTRRPVLVIGISLGMLATSLALLSAVDTLALVIAVVALQSFFLQAYSGSLFEVPLLHLGARGAGTINGFGNFWANIGGLVFSYVLGVVKDRTGSFDAGWLAVSAMCVVAVVATLAMRPPRSTPGDPAVPVAVTT